MQSDIAKAEGTDSAMTFVGGDNVLPLWDRRADLDREQSLFVVRTLRELTVAGPLSRSAVTTLAEGVGLDPATTKALLTRSAEVDKDGTLWGFGGLSLRQHRHILTVGRRTMWTWCAWDTLFLPALLGAPATVASTDPITGETVRLDVGTDRVRSFAPPATVVSFGNCNPADCTDGEALRRLFCDSVNFFATPASGEQWLRGQAGKGWLLSVEEAFALAMEHQAPLIEASQRFGPIEDP